MKPTISKIVKLQTETGFLTTSLIRDENQILSLKVNLTKISSLIKLKFIKKN